MIPASGGSAAPRRRSMTPDPPYSTGISGIFSDIDRAMSNFFNPYDPIDSPGSTQGMDPSIMRSAWGAHQGNDYSQAQMNQLPPHVVEEAMRILRQQMEMDRMQELAADHPIPLSQMSQVQSPGAYLPSQLAVRDQPAGYMSGPRSGR